MIETHFTNYRKDNDEDVKREITEKVLELIINRDDIAVEVHGGTHITLAKTLLSQKMSVLERESCGILTHPFVSTNINIYIKNGIVLSLEY
jgi:hypothetical protein